MARFPDPIPPEVIDAHPGAREALERTAALMGGILLRLEREGVLPLPPRDNGAQENTPSV